VSDAKPAVGYIGIGLMGTPMAMRLARAGYQLTVWGRTEAKLAAVLDAGAQRAANPEALARASDIVFLCVSDTEAVEAVVFGEQGVAAGITQEKLVVDMSSIRPEATVRMARRLREETGAGWLDAPVSGGVPGAESGTLAVMAGGAETDFHRALPVIEHLAGRVTLMGPSGAGQTTKLVNQLLVGCTLTIVSEATRFALDAGVDAARIPEALAGGRADSVAMQQWMPKLTAGDFTVESHLRTMLKDLNTVLALAREHGTALPMTATSAEIYRLLASKGFAEADVTSVFRLYDKA